MKGLIVSLLVGASLFLPVPADAADSAVCSSVQSLTLTPGITLNPGSSRYSTDGSNGVIVCVGSVKGHLITGPGAVGNAGNLNGTCAAGSGSGHFRARFPTDAGPVSVSGHYTFSYVGAAGTISGDFTGTFEFVPEPGGGDCVTAALTRVTLLPQGTLTS